MQEVIKDAFRSTRMKELQRFLSHLQSRHADPYRAEEVHESSAACESGLEESREAMEVDEYYR